MTRTRSRTTSQVGSTPGRLSDAPFAGGRKEEFGLAKAHARICRGDVPRLVCCLILPVECRLRAAAKLASTRAKRSTAARWFPSADRARSVKQQIASAAAIAAWMAFRRYDVRILLALRRLNKRARIVKSRAGVLCGALAASSVATGTHCGRRSNVTLSDRSGMPSMRRDSMSGLFCRTSTPKDATVCSIT